MGIKRFNNLLIMLFLASLSICTIDATSFFTLFIVAILALILNKVIFDGNDWSLVIILYSAYTILSVLIYWFQMWQFPQNFGCTGANIHGGTDDLFFFQEATNNGISYRGDRSIDMHHFSRFLQVFNNVVALYKKPKLIDLLIFNNLAISFIPVTTKKVSELLKFPEISTRITFIFTAICPILIISSLVLIRDGWIALFLILSIYFLLNKRLLLLILVILMTFYLRVASAGIILLFIAMILVFAGKEELPQFNLQKRTSYIIIFIVFVLINLSAIIFFLKFTTLLDNFFFRKDFLSFISESSHEKSAANFIYNLTPVLRIPISFVYYMGSPFLSVKEIWYNHSLTIRALFEQIFPVLFIFYFIYFVQFFSSFIGMKKNKIISLLFIVFLLSILILSQLSMQPRHKSMLMPIFYLIIGYGYQNVERNSKIIGFVIIIPIFILEIIYNFI